MYNSDSIRIVINQYKEGHLSEDETIKIIEDLTVAKTFYIPHNPWWETVRYDNNFIQPAFPKYEVTCNTTNHNKHD